MPSQWNSRDHRLKVRLVVPCPYLSPISFGHSGMEPTIRAVLSSLLPAEDANSIDIIANGVKYLDEAQKGDKWEIVYRHPESGYGHDKSKAILPYRDLPSKPTLFFCGDGVSGTSLIVDLDVREADLDS